MKPHLIQILIVFAIAAALGTAFHQLRDQVPVGETEINPAPLRPEKPGATVIKKREINLPTPESRAPTTSKPAPQTKSRAAARTTRPRPTPQQIEASRRRYWEQTRRQFNQQKTRLDHETDPIKRNNLIDRLARHVRIDTLAAIDWAMGLVEPAERRRALEAINVHALTGIGARIQLDDAGLPQIRETTIMSPVASTGLVEPGDYIVGIKNEWGETISFGGMKLPQVVEQLRGDAGTEVILMMERNTKNGTAVFEVPVQRALLVITPPY